MIALVIAALIASYIIFKTVTGENGVRAICVDGTVSFSKTNKGTCSYHQGVDRWTRDE